MNALVPLHPTGSRWSNLIVFSLLLSLVSCSLPRKNGNISKDQTRSAVHLNHNKLAENLLRIQQSTEPSPTGLTEQFVIGLQKKVDLQFWKEPIRISGKAGCWELSFHDEGLDLQGVPEWSPSVFQKVTPASSVEIEGYNEVVAENGAGVPLVLAYENVDQLRAERSFRPSNGLYVPGTLILEFGKAASPGQPTPVQCRIFNTYSVRSAKLAGRSVQLAYHVTAAIESNLDNKYMLKTAFAGLIRPGVHEDKDMGLFGLTSFAPEKIPVVFVHGLDSAPHIWRNAVNEIFADPKLSERYLPLLFMYPSGMAVPMAAAHLRRSLNLYRSRWDPQHRARGFDQMVIVGHSMGGLLTRLQVMDSGDELWRAFFSKPPSQIPWIEDEDKALLEKSLKFSAYPSVKRVVFVAVPHKGSNIADIGIVRLAIRLIRVPTNTAKYVTHAMTQETSLINPALLRYHALGMRSVDMLSPEHPYFVAINKRPIKTPFHSIVGNRGKDLGEKSSDGIVPYWSSHMPGAVSEEIVPYDHRCTLKKETVEEISRILHLHLAGR